MADPAKRQDEAKVKTRLAQEEAATSWAPICAGRVNTWRRHLQEEPDPSNEGVAERLPLPRSGKTRRHPTPRDHPRPTREARKSRHTNDASETLRLANR